MKNIIKHTKEFWEKRNIQATTKVCSKCGIEKDKSLFAEDKKHIDGKSSYCFDCKSLYNRNLYKNNSSRFYNSSQAWQSKNPEKRKAHLAVWYAVKSGKIAKPENCTVCNKTGRIEAHHWRGYDKEHILDIQWLCHACHEKADAL